MHESSSPTDATGLSGRAKPDDLEPRDVAETPIPNELRVNGAPGGYRELLLIAVPMIISSGTQSLMQVIDRVFLTWYSEAAVAASLPAGILFWAFLSLPSGIVSYTNAMVAQYDGAKQPVRASRCVWQSVYVALFSGGFLIIPAFYAPALFRFIDHGATVESLEVEYFAWLSIGAIPALLSAAFSAFFSGRGRTRLVLAVNAASMVVNALLDYAMVFGWGPFPRWGMAGAAIATDIANVFAALCFAGLLMTHDARVNYSFWKNWRFDPILMRDLFRFGGPSGIQMFLDVAGFAVFMMIIGKIGQRELAATNIAFNLNTLAFIPVIGVGIAVSTLVGHRIGEGRPDIAEKSARKGFALAGGIMLMFGAIYVCCPQLLLAPYAMGASNRQIRIVTPSVSERPSKKTEDSSKEIVNSSKVGDKPSIDVDDFAKISEVTIILLRFVAIYSFFDAMAIVFGSAIRAAGDTVFSMVVTFVCAWGLLVLPTYLTWQYYGKNHERELLFWSWAWCSIYVSVLGFVYLARFNGGRWKSMSIVEQSNT